MSFGMIFSIILIIIFLAVAFYGISKFLEFKDLTQTSKFVKDLQVDVDKMWGGFQGSEEFTYLLPNRIKLVCLIDYNSPSRGEYKEEYEELEQAFFEEENLFFYPVGSGVGRDGSVIRHLNITSTTENNNPLCFENKDGRVKISIIQDYGENSVRIIKNG